MTKMTENRLRDIIAAYGHQPQHWPADERRDAEALLAARPAAFRDALDEAAALDAQLDQLPAVDLPDGLISKVLDAAPMSQAGAGARRTVPPHSGRFQVSEPGQQARQRPVWRLAWRRVIPCRCRMRAPMTPPTRP